MLATDNRCQSILFNYSLNGLVNKKEIKTEKIIFKILGDSLVCKGTTVAYKTSTNEAASWSNGITSNSIQLTVLQDTEIKAAIKNEDGCEFEQTKVIKVLPLPDKPIINRTGDSLIVANVTGNFEWYRNGQIFNVGLNYIRTSLEGNYTVKVINNDGCENESDVFLLTSTNEAENNSVIIYPNPASDKIWIKPSLNLLNASSIRVFSIDGRNYPVFYNGENLDVSHLRNGYYIMVLTDKTKTSNYSFVKAE